MQYPPATIFKFQYPSNRVPSSGNKNPDEVSDLGPAGFNTLLIGSLPPAVMNGGLMYAQRRMFQYPSNRVPSSGMNFMAAGRVVETVSIPF